MIANHRVPPLAALLHDLRSRCALRWTLVLICAGGGLCWGAVIVPRINGSQSGSPPNLQLSSTLIGQANAIAVINGRPVGLDGRLTIDNRTYRVIGITPGNARLRLDDDATIDLAIKSAYDSPWNCQASTSLDPFGKHAEPSRP